MSLRPVTRGAHSNGDEPPFIPLRLLVIVLVAIATAVLLQRAGAPIEGAVGTAVAVLLALVHLVR